MFFDIGMGLLVAAVVGCLTGRPASGEFLVIGVVGNLWPDLDFILWKLRGKPLDHRAHEHRELLHRPLALLPPFLAGIAWFFGWREALVFAIASGAHFLHDMPVGWGIRLFWPIDNRFWAYKAYGSRPKQLYAWTKDQQVFLCEQYGNRSWMKQGYGGLTSSLLIEIDVLIIGAIAAIVYFAIFPST